MSSPISPSRHPRLSLALGALLFLAPAAARADAGPSLAGTTALASSDAGTGCAVSGRTGVGGSLVLLGLVVLAFARRRKAAGFFAGS